MLMFVFKCVACCLWCFEKCLKYLSKNAYIVISIKGQTFCGAAKEVFFIILHNTSYVGVVGVISPFLMALGKIAVHWRRRSRVTPCRASGTTGHCFPIRFLYNNFAKALFTRENKSRAATRRA